MKLVNRFKNEVWKKAVDVEFLDHLDTIQMNKVCPWCGEPMVYEDFISDAELGNRSSNSWTIGYSLPLSQGGNKKLDNLQAIHARCELEKLEGYTITFGLDN